MTRTAARILLYCLVAYLVVSINVYRFRHTRMTETQLFIHLGDAVRWKP